MAALVDEGIGGEYLGRDDPDRLRMAQVDGRLRNEGRDHTLGEDVQGVDQKGRHLVVIGIGNILGRESDELANIHRRFSNRGGFLKRRANLLKLFGS